ncbi:MAG: hypothetical protein R2939_21415 [Kofleriaceae bacterium]
MSDAALPPCGLYRTTAPVGELPAGRLVYFHNHGNPGAGVYVPERWDHNRARFSPRGTTLPAGYDVSTLKPLPVEGFYRVASSFVCCPKKCVTFAPDLFVQLGYNGAGQALLFQPELAGGAIQVPERGTPVDDDALTHLVALAVRERKVEGTQLDPFPRGIVVH